MISSHELRMPRKGRLTRTCLVATFPALRQNPEPSSRSGTSRVGRNTFWGKCEKAGSKYQTCSVVGQEAGGPDAQFRRCLRLCTRALWLWRCRQAAAPQIVVSLKQFKPLFTLTARRYCRPVMRREHKDRPSETAVFPMGAGRRCCGCGVG
jgi:hypothetical protein